MATGGHAEIKAELAWAAGLLAALPLGSFLFCDAWVVAAIMETLAGLVALEYIV